MTPHDLIAAFEALAEAPDGVERLRALILQLAVQGTLVPQDPADEPVTCLLKQLREGRERLLKEKTVNEPRHPVGVLVEHEPYDIPSTWTWVRLGDAGAIVGGGTPKTGESSYWADGNDVPWLTPADMRHQLSRYITRGRRDITRAGLASSGAQLLPGGTVLFSSRAPIGHVGIAASPLSTNQGFKSCVPYVAAMSEYLYMFLREVGPEVGAAATGTTFKEVTGKDVALIPLPLPPLAEQYRIVARVDELMGLLDRLEAARTKREATRASVRDSALAALRDADAPEEIEVAWNRFAERMDDLVADPSDIAPLRQTVLELAVRGRLVPQDPSDEPASVLLQRMAKEEARQRQRGAAKKLELPPVPPDDEPFALPASWRWARLADVSSRIHYGYTASADMSYKTHRLLRITDIQNNRVDWTAVPGCAIDTDDFPKYALRDGDIVIARTGGTVGKTYRIEGLGQLQAVFASYLIRVVPARLISGRYLKRVLESPLYWGQLASKTAGTGQPNVSASALSLLIVPVPPMSEQDRIVARVEELMSLLDRLEERFTTARTTHAAFAAAAVHHLDTRAPQ